MDAALVARHPTAAEMGVGPFRRMIAGVGGRRGVHVRAQVRRVVRAGLQMFGGVISSSRRGVTNPDFLVSLPLAPPVRSTGLINVAVNSLGEPLFRLVFAA
jgi:hypothetical protein